MYSTITIHIYSINVYMCTYIYNFIGFQLSINLLRLHLSYATFLHNCNSAICPVSHIYIFRILETDKPNLLF